MIHPVWSALITTGRLDIIFTDIAYPLQVLVPDYGYLTIALFVLAGLNRVMRQRLMFVLCASGALTTLTSLIFRAEIDAVFGLYPPLPFGMRWTFELGVFVIYLLVLSRFEYGLK